VVESTRVATPAWLRLEAVWGAANNLHHPGVAAAAFAADGRTLVTAGRKGELRVWDLAAHVLRDDIRTCVPPQPGSYNYSYIEGARALALSPDGLAAVGFAGGKVCVIELAGGRMLRIIDAHKAHVVALAFVGDRLRSYGSQDTIVSETSIGMLVDQEAAGGEVRWWNPRTGAKLGELALARGTLAVAPGPKRFATADDKKIAAFAPDGRKLWERSDLAEGWSGFTQPCAFAGPDTLLVASPKGLSAMEADTGRNGGAFAPAAAAAEYQTALAVSEDGRLAATVTEKRDLVLWDVRARREIRRRSSRAAHPRIGPRAIVFSPDGSKLVTWNEEQPAVWRTDDLEVVSSARMDALTCLMFMPDSRRAVICAHGVAHMVDVANGRITEQWAIKGRGATLLADETRSIDVDYDKVWVRDRVTGAPLWTTRREPRERVLASPDGRQVETCDRGRAGMRLHDAATGIVSWNRAGVEPMAFSADGGTIYARTRDWHVLGLDSRTGAVRLDIDRKRTETTDFFPAPDGKRALALHYEHLAGYDLATGARLWQADKDSPYRCVILPGSQVFVSYGHMRIRLRSMATGLDIGPEFSFDGLPGYVTGFAVSPDGKTMLLWTGEAILMRFAIDPKAAADP
jgi:WD40 repeat protein